MFIGSYYRFPSICMLNFSNICLLTLHENEIIKICRAYIYWTRSKLNWDFPKYAISRICFKLCGIFLFFRKMIYFKWYISWYILIFVTIIRGARENFLGHRIKFTSSPSCWQYKYIYSVYIYIYSHNAIILYSSRAHYCMRIVTLLLVYINKLITRVIISKQSLVVENLTRKSDKSLIKRERSWSNENASHRK
jgi:hypothetical protein